MKKSVLFAMNIVLFFSSSWAMAAVNMWYSSETYSATTNEFCNYSYSIPVLKAGDGSTITGIEALNAKWKAEALSSVAAYEQSTAEAETCTSFGMAFQEHSSFQISTPLSAKYASIVTTTYGYYGGAHGNSGRQAVTFNTQTGKVYNSLADVIGSSAMPAFKAAVEQQLIDEYELDPSFGWSSVKESWTSPWDVKNFFLTENGVVIYFDPYEVNGYAAGPQDVEIYWYQIKQMGTADTDLAKELTE